MYQLHFDYVVLTIWIPITTSQLFIPEVPCSTSHNGRARYLITARRPLSCNVGHSRSPISGMPLPTMDLATVYLESDIESVSYILHIN